MHTGMQKVLARHRTSAACGTSVSSAPMYASTGSDPSAKRVSFRSFWHEVMLHALSHITYDMRGLASGDMCEYLHQYDMKRMPLCHFFAEGQCTKEDCQFLHIRPEDKIVECPWSSSSSPSPSLLLNLSLPPAHFFSGLYQFRSSSLEKSCISLVLEV